MQTKKLLDGKKLQQTHKQKYTQVCALMRQRHTEISTHLILSKKMGESRESERARDERAADGQKDVNPFSFFPDSIRALWVTASGADVKEESQVT